MINKDEKDSFIEPIFGLIEEEIEIPKQRISDKAISPRKAYRLIKDELFCEGNARQNLATFTQTFMEDEAQKLMMETMEKNAIDKSEYPKTAELENRCVDIIANLWNSNKKEQPLGCSTVGSSEACMLGGMALKIRWEDYARTNNIDLNKQKPNLVISAGYQVCWEKFCVYWDIEMRTIPMDEEHLNLNLDSLFDYIDDYTIGIIGILGITYTGKFDDIASLNKLVEQYNKAHAYPLSIHVDAASGGLFTPFINPELRWDFRLKNVVSINTSGHKYGLVYPGIGWVVWRSQQYLPQRLIFKVSYLGGEMPTMAINFSRSASQIIGQYYNFLRFGFNGYHSIHQRTLDVAKHLAQQINKIGFFELYNEGDNLPIVCYRLKNTETKWTLYELADRLAMKGWQVPAYPLPPNLEEIIVQRIVCRADFGFNMAETFINDLHEAIYFLNKDAKQPQYRRHGFTH